MCKQKELINTADEDTYICVGCDAEVADEDFCEAHPLQDEVVVCKDCCAMCGSEKRAYLLYMDNFTEADRLAALLHLKAIILRSEMRLDEAIECEREGLLIANSHLQKAKHYAGLALAYRLAKRFSEALDALSHARSFYEEADCAEGLAITHANTANLLLEMNETKQAERFILRAIELFTCLHEDVWLAQAQETKARIHLARERYVEAFEAACRSVRYLALAADCGVSIKAFDEAKRTLDKTTEELRAHVARKVAEEIISRALNLVS